jgi:opacity protein-like surface antigen
MQSPHNVRKQQTAPRLACRVVVLLLTAAAGFPAAAAADGEQTASRGTVRTQPDFLFERPSVSVSLRGIWNRARAESDFYEFVHEELFVRRDADEDARDLGRGGMSFDAPGIGFEVGVGLTPRIDLAFGVDLTRAFARSELREYVGSDGLPIEQETSLRQVDLTGGLRFALAPRGRAIGQYAWIPSAVVPYVGIGGGFLHHSLQQAGEFVDPFTDELFAEIFASSGWTLSSHALAGVDIRLTSRVYTSIEARYVWADDDLVCRRPLSGVFGPPEPLGFCGFEPIDLTGLRIQAGVRFVF